MIHLRYTALVSALLVALVINAAAYARAYDQAGANRAGLIVQLKDGTLITRCVTFTEPEISGYDLLRRAGMQVTMDVSMGGAVCKIGNSGCNYPSQQCFCECQDMNQSCVYWMYYQQVVGAWKYSVLGATVAKVNDGAVQGWVYGAGSTSTGGAPPPLLTIDQICASAPQPSATALPTTQPVPTAAASATPAPTNAPVSTLTPTTAATDRPALAASPQPTISLTATALPSATAAPQTTATPTAIPSTATVAAPPTATLAVPSATSDQPVTQDATSNAAPPTSGYIVFGIIAVGLLGGWIIMQRRTTRKSQ